MFDETIQISVLGDFEMRCGEFHFSASDIGNQSCSLFVFLLTHKNCSSDNIVEALWPDGVSNPASALKNLIYRTRKSLMEKNFPHAKDFIVSDHGTYKINSNINVELDAVIMENTFIKAQQSTDAAEKIELYSLGVNIYKGEFLKNLSNYEWTVPLEQHYHSLFFKNLYILLDMHHAMEDYADILVLAKHGVQFDKFEENAHKYLMYALHKSGDSAKAMAYYSYMIEIFYNGLGVELSDSTQALYREITKASKASYVDIQTLQSDLNDLPGEQMEPLFCNMDVFKQLYHFTSRSSIRSGASFFIGLLTISISGGDSAVSDLRETAMLHLKDSIALSLRNGDAFARCSPGQYLLMLPMINFENGQVVLERVEKSFKSIFHSRRVTISHNILPVEPALWS